ncbi:lysophospholipid acyltransferase family protein [Paenibacillus sp. UNC451MF]|uniref:lysophospholipid acyltransferase family protein n=1 Tax=Paenibacillus sp. UNC451MF TaxID=1449063 RepID=UPI0007E8C125|nr:lysophospholipid acyltransferase family protein [Paenibacillus sp. UNC451MF]
MYEWIGAITKQRKVWGKLESACSRIPRPIMLLICKCLGMIWFIAVSRGFGRRVKHNLQELLSERSKLKVKGYQVSYYQNLIITLYELWLDTRRLNEIGARRFQAEGEEHLEEALRLSRGAIVYTPHVGNFFYYYWYLCQKYSCLTIVTSGCEELQPLYYRFRDMGCAGLDYDDTPPLELVRKLRSHLAANGVVFILGDFYRPTFPLSRFFGKATRTPEGAASLAIDYQVPIIPFHGHREKGFNHKLKFEQPLHLYASFQRSQRTEATKVLNRYMERVIREYPAHWFYWFNADERWENECLTDSKEDSHSMVNLSAGRELKKQHSA